MLSGAGLDTHSVAGGTVTLGAALPISALADLAGTVPALAACALNLADYEIRGQGDGRRQPLRRHLATRRSAR